MIEKKKLAMALVLGAGLALGLGFNLLTDNLNDTGSGSDGESWQSIPLEDVRNGEEFRISEMEKPLLVETFAVWCPTCTRQQQEVKKLHEESNISSVSLDVDPNEKAGKVRNHIQENGFDWHYAISPPELTQELIRNYGNSIANPPSAPMILVCENGTRRLQNGVKPASKLKEEVRKGC